MKRSPASYAFDGDKPLPAELFAADKTRTYVVSKCGCLYRYDYEGRRWYCAFAGPPGPHDMEFFAELQKVDPAVIAAGYCMAKLGVGA